MKATKTLENYFKPKLNVPYERHAFRQMSQKPDETIDQFIVRLRMKADTYDFIDANAIEEQLREQVIEKCHSNQLSHKLLAKGRTLTLAQLQDTSRTFEDSERSARSMEGGLASRLTRCRLTVGGAIQLQQSTKRVVHQVNISFACGRTGHIAKDPQCPAKNQKCRKWHMMGHFQIRCKSKQVKSQKIDRPQKTDPERVHQIEEGEPYYAFTVTKISENNCDSAIDVKVGGINLPMIIDSGASCIILGREQWETLKANNIQCVSSKETKNCTHMDPLSH